MTDPATSLPPNARIEAMSFDDGARMLTIALRDDAAPRTVAADDVEGLFGARIRHESTTLVTSGGGISFGKIAVTAATGIPVGITKERPKETAVTGEELLHALALRVRGVSEAWYLLAQSFNLRKALGPDATYSSDMNRKLFVKRLAAFMPAARKDGYVDAVVANAALPPPLDSLLEFLRSTAISS